MESMTRSSVLHEATRTGCYLTEMSDEQKIISLATPFDPFCISLLVVFGVCVWEILNPYSTKYGGINKTRFWDWIFSAKETNAWQKSVHILINLQRQQLRVGYRAYGAAIHATTQARAWQAALECLEEATVNNFVPGLRLRNLMTRGEDNPCFEVIYWENPFDPVWFWEDYWHLNLDGCNGVTVCLWCMYCAAWANWTKEHKKTKDQTIVSATAKLNGHPHPCKSFRSPTWSAATVWLPALPKQAPIRYQLEFAHKMSRLMLSSQKTYIMGGNIFQFWTGYVRHWCVRRLEKFSSFAYRITSLLECNQLQQPHPGGMAAGIGTSELDGIPRSGGGCGQLQQWHVQPGWRR